MAVPQGLAYAILAGMPPIYGLYSCTFPLLVYSLLGTSGQIALGPVAMISLLTSGTINAIPDITPDLVIPLVHALALLYGIATLLLGVLKLGSITQFLSHEVLGGFTSAAAIAVTWQLSLLSLLTTSQPKVDSSIAAQGLPIGRKNKRSVLYLINCLAN